LPSAQHQLLSRIPPKDSWLLRTECGSISKIGTGKQIVLIPADLFLYPAFARLAPGQTLIFYDMRDRGHSDAVADPRHITIQDDVNDLETIRKHFGVDKPALIGFSYLGMMVMLYAVEHLNHVSRIVQLGRVSRKFGETFPPSLSANDPSPVPDAAQMRQLEDLEKSGYIREHPKELCEKEWQVTHVQLVGDPANAANLGASKCDLPNEWPSHVYPHFAASISSIQALDIPVEKLKTLRVPVLTIHGTKDRNAPYGGGRQCSMPLPESRLVSVPGAAHMSWIEAPELVFSVSVSRRPSGQRDRDRIMRRGTHLQQRPGRDSMVRALRCG
jgi:proline iminopeptidase